MLSIGVDFGTSNSTCSVRLPDGEIRSVILEPGRNSEHILPSWWHYPEGGQKVIVGSAAKDSYIDSYYSGRFITSVKTHLRDLTLRSTRIAGKSITLEEIVAELLRKIRKSAEDQYGPIGKGISSPLTTFYKCNIFLTSLNQSLFIHMFGKPQWFARRKYLGWGLMPITWQGWAYTLVLVAPIVIAQYIPGISFQARTIFMACWLVVVFAEVAHIMVNMKKDERDTLHEAIAERNALWMVLVALVGGAMYQVVTQIDASGTIAVDPVILVALVAGLVGKAATNVYLDRKD
jgi:hypothetical protein